MAEGCRDVQVVLYQAQSHIHIELRVVVLVVTRDDVDRAFDFKDVALDGQSLDWRRR